MAYISAILVKAMIPAIPPPSQEVVDASNRLQHTMDKAHKVIELASARAKRDKLRAKTLVRANEEAVAQMRKAWGG